MKPKKKEKSIQEMTREALDKVYKESLPTLPKNFGKMADGSNFGEEIFNPYMEFGNIDKPKSTFTWKQAFILLILVELIVVLIGVSI